MRADYSIKLAYMTGILPIKKYGTQSGLNNFREMTMIHPFWLDKHIGFSEDDAKALCDESGMPFVEMRKWCGGYLFDQTEDLREGYCEEHDGFKFLSCYNPSSVMETIRRHGFGNH